MENITVSIYTGDNTNTLIRKLPDLSLAHGIAIMKKVYKELLTSGEPHAVYLTDTEDNILEFFELKKRFV